MREELTGSDQLQVAGVDLVPRSVIDAGIVGPRSRP
jgi:hypothetical protein